MGLPTTLFVTPPDDNLICAVCHDVLESPCTCRCGHSFCKDCIEASLRTAKKCPTCRQNVKKTDAFPNVALRNLIENLEVRCGNGANDDVAQPPDHQRRRLDSGDSLPVPRTAGCGWSGKLSELHSHKTSECQLETVQCDFEGCSFQCARKDMEAHKSSSAGIMSHTKALLKIEVTKVKAELEADAKRKISEVKRNCELQIEEVKQQQVHLFLNSFCRRWIERRPDALSEFVVYRGCVQSRRDGLLSFEKKCPIMLLCGIPGPKRTPWEGGLFPVLMRWINLAKPPLCKLPKGFHHLNVYPGGTMSVLSVIESQGWHPETSIPEILFECQQFLAHPNPFSPAQRNAFECFDASKDEYNKKAKEQARKYSPAAFLETVKNPAAVFQVPARDNPVEWESMRWVEVDDRSKDLTARCTTSAGTFSFVSQSGSCERRSESDNSDEEDFSPQDRDNHCPCSCCEWASSFWDDRREIRFLFGGVG